MTTDAELERWLALYRDCCVQGGVEPLSEGAAVAGIAVVRPIGPAPIFGANHAMNAV